MTLFDVEDDMILFDVEGIIDIYLQFFLNIELEILVLEVDYGIRTPPLPAI